MKELSDYPYYIFKEFSDKLGKTLEPIELADNGHIARVKDSDNKIYCIDSNVLFHIADTLEEARNILNQNKSLEFEKVREID